MCSLTSGHCHSTDVLQSCCGVPNVCQWDSRLMSVDRPASMSVDDGRRSAHQLPHLRRPIPSRNLNHDSRSSTEPKVPAHSPNQWQRTTTLSNTADRTPRSCTGSCASCVAASTMVTAGTRDGTCEHWLGPMQDPAASSTPDDQRDRPSQDIESSRLEHANDCEADIGMKSPARDHEHHVADRRRRVRSTDRCA